MGPRGGDERESGLVPNCPSVSCDARPLRLHLYAISDGVSVCERKRARKNIAQLWLSRALNLRVRNNNVGDVTQYVLHAVCAGTC